MTADQITALMAIECVIIAISAFVFMVKWQKRVMRNRPPIHQVTRAEPRRPRRRPSRRRTAYNSWDDAEECGFPPDMW